MRLQTLQGIEASPDLVRKNRQLKSENAELRAVIDAHRRQASLYMDSLQGAIGPGRPGIRLSAVITQHRSRARGLEALINRLEAQGAGEALEELLQSPVLSLTDAKSRLKTVRELIEALATGDPFTGRQEAISTLTDVSQFLKRLINGGEALFGPLAVETE